MTTVSTLLALLLLPLLLNFYTAEFIDELNQLSATGTATEFVIPITNIIGSLVLVLLPVGLGMWLRAKSPEWAKTAEDTAGFMGIIVIVYLIVTALFRHVDLLFQTPGKIYFAAICVGLLGFLFGYWMARLFGLSPIFQRAISVETGIQNTPVAFAIILLSFVDPIQSQMLWLAVLYASFIVITSSIITLYYRRTGRFDWEVYKNTSVHNRLFGDDYITSYPKGYLPKRIKQDPSQGAAPAQRREE
jgi:BASS family bile acid:Na+ symporter